MVATTKRLLSQWDRGATNRPDSLPPLPVSLPPAVFSLMRLFFQNATAGLNDKSSTAGAAPMQTSWSSMDNPRAKVSRVVLTLASRVYDACAAEADVSPLLHLFHAQFIRYWFDNRHLEMRQLNRMAEHAALPFDVAFFLYQRRRQMKLEAKLAAAGNAMTVEGTGMAERVVSQRRGERGGRGSAQSTSRQRLEIPACVLGNNQTVRWHGLRPVCVVCYRQRTSSSGS